MNKARILFDALCKDERGTGMLEYGVVTGLAITGSLAVTARANATLTPMIQTCIHLLTPHVAR